MSTWIYIGLALAAAWIGIGVLFILFFHAASKIERWEQERRRVSEQVGIRNGHCGTHRKMRMLRSVEPVKWTCALPNYNTPCDFCYKHDRCMAVEASL